MAPLAVAAPPVADEELGLVIDGLQVGAAKWAGTSTQWMISSSVRPWFISSSDRVEQPEAGAGSKRSPKAGTSATICPHPAHGAAGGQEDGSEAGHRVVGQMGEIGLFCEGAAHLVDIRRTLHHAELVAIRVPEHDPAVVVLAELLAQSDRTEIHEPFDF